MSKLEEAKREMDKAYEAANTAEEFAEKKHKEYEEALAEDRRENFKPNATMVQDMEMMMVPISSTTADHLFKKGQRVHVEVQRRESLDETGQLYVWEMATVWGQDGQAHELYASTFKVDDGVEL